MEEITGRKIPHYSIDLLNREALKEVFKKVSNVAVLKKQPPPLAQCYISSAIARLDLLGGGQS